jgi:hypothetical protein
MNLDGKDLDGLLKNWRSPMPGKAKGAADRLGSASAGTGLNEQEEEERNWDERADAIVKAALAAKPSSADVLGGLLAEPPLAAEPGEAAARPGDGAQVIPISAAGEKKMAQEKEPGDPPTSVANPAERKRTSLKEIAARASQSGVGRPSSPGVAPSAPATVTPLPRPAAATPLPRPVEAAKDDSGVINLNVVRATATAQQVAAAEKAKPASAGLFEDDKTVESADNPAAQPRPTKTTKVAVVEAKKSNTAAFAGVAIAALGIAAAFAIVMKQPAAPPQSAAMAESKPVAAATAAATAPPPAATATAISVADLAPAASASPDSAAAKGVAAAPAGASGAASAATAAATATADGRLAAKAPTDKPGDLASEMAKRVGAVNDPKGAPEGATPEPAAGAKNQNIPEQPSQGSVQSAVGAVIGGAKGCVAGATDISRAQVTFSSNGTVSNVSVTGWAAANGKDGCIKAALKGAKVGAFSKPTFTVPVSIRP